MKYAIVLGVVTLSFASPAGADDNLALATDLFDAGVKKMADGRCEESPIGDRAVCAEAREDFRRAYELYPAGLGALRNLAFVEKGLGLVASSARHFRELARKAPLDPKPARRLWAEFARTELEALEPRVPHLTVKVPADAPESARVLVDGSPLPRAAWNTSLDLDPGKHEIRGEGGDSPVVQTVELAEGENKSVDLALATKADKSVATTSPVSDDETAPWWRSPRLAPLVVTGVGAATVVAGLGLGWAAIEKHKDVCADPGCDPEAYSDGKALARASTIVTGIGLATAASGIVWYVLSAPRDPERRTAVVPSAWAGGGGLTVLGHF